jgi:hypothetical protein
LASLSVKWAELWLHAFRIGSVRHREEFLRYLIPLATAGVGFVSTETVIRVRVAGIHPLKVRRWFLLLVRWVRENNETQFVRELLSQTHDYDAGPWWTHFGASGEAGPAAIDLDRASADLTYREAMDLRWALDIWRESGAHWPGEPTDPTAPNPAPQSPEPPAKRRRPRR